MRLVDGARLPITDDVAGPSMRDQRAAGAERQVPDAAEGETKRDVIVRRASLRAPIVRILYSIAGAAAVARIERGILEVDRSAIGEACNERESLRETLFKARRKARKCCCPMG